MLKVGDVVGGYRIEQILGHGGRTVVYRAYQTTIARRVTLKVLLKHDPEVLARFQHEAQLTANISHPGVRQVFDANQTPDGYPYLALQYVDSSLLQHMRNYREQGRAFTPQEVAEILAPVAGVLDYLHKRGMVHLDIKPENILMYEDGQTVLADFGSARRIGSTTHEGTPAYFSPEQAAGNLPVVPQTDVYSLAVVAYELLAGQRPFGGGMDIVLARQHLEEPPRPLNEINPKIDPGLAAAVQRALSKDPNQRPVSAQAFIEQLRAAGMPSRETPHQAPPPVVLPEQPEQPQRPQKRGPQPRGGRSRGGRKRLAMPRLLAAIAGVIVLLVCGGLVALALLLPDAAEPGSPSTVAVAGEQEGATVITEEPPGAPDQPTRVPPRFPPGADSGPLPGTTGPPTSTPRVAPTRKATRDSGTTGAVQTVAPASPTPASGTPTETVACAIQLMIPADNITLTGGTEVFFRWQGPVPAGGDYYEVRVDGRSLGSAWYSEDRRAWEQTWAARDGPHTWQVMMMSSDKRTVLCSSVPRRLNIGGR